VPKGKTYTLEFKEQAARRVVENSLPIAQVARELGGTPDGERIRELERRNRELEMEVAFLRKASAYFAREHR
jgi:transposase-like protein